MLCFGGQHINDQAVNIKFKKIKINPNKYEHWSHHMLVPKAGLHADHAVIKFLRG